MPRDLNLEARTAELLRRRLPPSRAASENSGSTEYAMSPATARHSPTLRAEGVYGERGLPHHHRHLVLGEGRMAPLAGHDGAQALEAGGVLGGVLRDRQRAAQRRGVWAPPEPALDNRLVGRGLRNLERNDPDFKKQFDADLGGRAPPPPQQQQQPQQRRRNKSPAPKNARNVRKVLVKVRHGLVASRGNKGVYAIEALRQENARVGVQRAQAVKHRRRQYGVVGRGLKPYFVPCEVGTKQVVEPHQGQVAGADNADPARRPQILRPPRLPLVQRFRPKGLAPGRQGVYRKLGRKPGIAHRCPRQKVRILGQVSEPQSEAFKNQKTGVKRGDIGHRQ